MKAKIRKVLRNNFLFQNYQRFKVKRAQKIFVIGRNKTGTTSLKDEFLLRKFPVANQRKSELLIDSYIEKDFNKIIDFAKTAQVFQDVPFSFPETFKYLDKEFPDSKFILTVRDNPEQWYNSITTFHSKLFGNGKIPTKIDLENSGYVYKGWIWKTNRVMYDTSSENPYEKEILIKSYIDYNQSVLDYFEGTGKLLVINVAEKESYKKFCNFLNLPFIEGRQSFLWSNKTKKIK